MTEVSIIIPTYNYGRFIRNAIDSVLNQEVFSDYEIIVVDDGSTDDTLAILSIYKNAIHLLRQRNKGASAARNKGILASNGKYIVFLDADDRLFPDSLSSRYVFLESNTDIGWVYGPVVYVDEAERNVDHKFRNYPFAFRNKRSGWILTDLLLGELIHLPSVMVRSSIVKEAGGFDSTLPSLQDYDLWLRVACRSPVGYINNVQAIILSHEGSISRSGHDGYQTRLNILKKAEMRYPEAIGSLGWKWMRYSAEIFGERGRHFISTNPEKALSLLAEAIRRNPINCSHYIGFLKAWLQKWRVN